MKNIFIAASLILSFPVFAESSSTNYFLDQLNSIVKKYNNLKIAQLCDGNDCLVDVKSNDENSTPIVQFILRSEENKDNKASRTDIAFTDFINSKSDCAFAVCLQNNDCRIFICSNYQDAKKAYENGEF